MNPTAVNTPAVAPWFWSSPDGFRSVVWKTSVGFAITRVTTVDDPSPSVEVWISVINPGVTTAAFPLRGSVDVDSTASKNVESGDMVSVVVEVIKLVVPLCVVVEIVVVGRDSSGSDLFEVCVSPPGPSSADLLLLLLDEVDDSWGGPGPGGGVRLGRAEEEDDRDDDDGDELEPGSGSSSIGPLPGGRVGDGELIGSDMEGSM